MTNKDKEEFCDLMIRCIGDRTLDLISADTEDAIKEMREKGELLDGKLKSINRISRNMLSRLKNGDFTRFPSIEYLKILTHEKAKPQNSVTFEDFEKIIKSAGSHDIKEENAADRQQRRISEKYLLGIVVKYLFDNFTEVKIQQEKRLKAGHFSRHYRVDLYAEVSNNETGTEKYVFEINIDHFPHADFVIAKIATYSCILNSDICVVVTNNIYLFKELQYYKLTNIKTKVQAWLIDVEIEEIVEIAYLN